MIHRSFLLQWILVVIFIITIIYLKMKLNFLEDHYKLLRRRYNRQLILLIYNSKSFILLISRSVKGDGITQVLSYFQTIPSRKNKTIFKLGQKLVSILTNHLLMISSLSTTGYQRQHQPVLQVWSTICANTTNIMFYILMFLTICILLHLLIR